MDRLKGIASFCLVVVGIFLALRLIHVGVPIFYPKVLAGPFSLDRIESVSEYTDFSPRLPFYRPQQLGTQPVNITVARRPYPKVVIFWQADHFLYLSEQRGGQVAPRRPNGQPLPRHPEATWWREGQVYTVQFQQDDLSIELRTDLSLQDVERIVDTLRPYEKLL